MTKRRHKQKKRSLAELQRKPAVNRKHKDKLFRRVFRDKEHLLALYNAINHTSYQNADDLEITTLEDAIYLSMKNDLSFIISSAMNLYEHQSTFNPNMPLRGLLYFARLYETYINVNSLDILGRRLVELPSPQYIVFYNGRGEQPDERILKLSDSFSSATGRASEPALECRVRMLNINYGHNQELMENCSRLMEYSYFVELVNRALDNGCTPEDAVEHAIDICTEKGFLTDILIQSKSEVLDMLLTEFNEERYKKSLLEEGQEIGMRIVNQLHKLLLEAGRSDDVLKAIENVEYQNELLKEFHLL